MQKTAVYTTRQPWDRAADMYQAGLFQSYDWGILMEELPGTSFHPVRLTTDGGQVIYLPLFEQKGVLSGNMIGYGGVISDRPISFEWLQSEIQTIFGRNISRICCRTVRLLLQKKSGKGGRKRQHGSLRFRTRLTNFGRAFPEKPGQQSDTLKKRILSPG
ncbi:hypothetical protein QNN00_07570 [Bacillus velezensis]|nr:hypothetical protein [Bacillus velezensis]